MLYHGSNNFVKDTLIINKASCEVNESGNMYGVYASNNPAYVFPYMLINRKECDSCVFSENERGEVKIEVIADKEVINEFGYLYYVKAAGFSQLSKRRFISNENVSVVCSVKIYTPPFYKKSGSGTMYVRAKEFNDLSYTIQSIAMKFADLFDKYADKSCFTLYLHAMNTAFECDEYYTDEKHGIDHALRVTGYAIMISFLLHITQNEKLMHDIVFAAMVHDLGRFYPPDSEHHSTRSAAYIKRNCLQLNDEQFVIDSVSMHSDELPLCDNIYKSILRDADIIDHLRFGIGTVDSSRLYLRESMIVYRLVLNDMLNPGNDLLQVYAFPLAFGGPCVTESGSKVMMWEFLKWHSELEDQSRIFDLAFSESPDQYVHKLEKVMKRRIGKRTLILGGNHLSVLPCYLALQDMTVLVFDAHRDYLKEESISHASFLRYTNCDQIFIFGYRDKITEEPPSNIYNYVLSEKEKLLSCIEDRKHKNVFIDIDIDVFDPSLITSTNSALPNGLQMDDIWEIVEKVGKDNVLWVSLSEYIPLIDSELDDMRVLQGLIEWIFDLV